LWGRGGTVRDLAKNFGNSFFKVFIARSELVTTWCGMGESNPRPQFGKLIY
jgi:hypothetical protein